MAKKIVRGITDVKTINNQDYDTNNVNDLLSDGQYNYIHRKKGKNEEYHNLTDNIKTLSSDNTELLSVTNYNKTTNTALLSPKHDAQKEQVIESTRDTVTIHHGTNGTAEKTTVDTNPKKVLEHDKLKTGDGLGTLFNNDETTIILKPTSIEDLPATNGLYFGNVVKDGLQYTAISLNIDNNKYLQLAFRESVGEPGKIVGKYRFMNNNVPTIWKEMVLDDETIKGFLAQKQDKLTAGEGITIEGQTIGLKTIDNYSGDLNELTETCLVKPTDNAVHLPGIDDPIIVIPSGEGILTVVKIGDTVSQKYHDLNNRVYTRVGGYIEGEWRWGQWSDGGVTPSN